MERNYYSVLLCFHSDRTDLYRDGLPIGVVRNGVFHLHQRLLPDGRKVAIELPADIKPAVAGVLALLP